MFCCNAACVLFLQMVLIEVSEWIPDEEWRGRRNPIFFALVGCVQAGRGKKLKLKPDDLKCFAVLHSSDISV